MIKKIATIMTMALFASAVFAQTAIGVVDADVVIQKSAKGKAFFEQYQNVIKQKQDEIKAMVDSFQAQQKDLQAKAASLSPDKAKEMRDELTRMQTDIKRKQEDAQRETESQLNDKLNEFRKELAPLIREIATEKGLDLVINYGPNSNLVYISDKVNITNDVIAKYDSKQ